jgi:hypothetical protein
VGRALPEELPPDDAEEKAEARKRLERRYSAEYGKKVTVDTTKPSPAC